MKRLLKLANKIFLSNYADLKEPYRLTYIVTHKCQLKCNMCNIWQRSDLQELSLSQIRKFFQKSNRFSWINLSGGETFLRKDIYDIIETIYNNCKNLYLLDFPTNGFNTDFIVDIIKRILPFKIPRLIVTVSLDGPPHVHDEVRGIPGSWDNAVKTFDSLRKLRSRNFNVFLGMTLQPSNSNMFMETVESVNKTIKDVGFDDFHINIIHYSDHYYGNTGGNNFKQKEALWKQLGSIMRLRKVSCLNAVGYLERRYQDLSKTYLYTNKTPILCQSLSASFFMGPTGDVYPCSIYNELIGNVKDYDYDIYSLWNTYARKGLREKIRKGSCPQCWTPCEAYQSIVAQVLPGFRKARN